MRKQEFKCHIGACNYPEGECNGDCVRKPQREGDQDAPVPNTMPAIQDLVIQDMNERKQIGIKRYGTPLQPHNGRDMMKDLYEELLDACNYIRGQLYERDGK